MYPFINIRQHRTPAFSLSSAPSRDRQGVGNDVPNERNSEYASSTEVTEIEFHRRTSDYPRGDELHATQGCASRRRICVYVRFILWSCQSSVADETDGGNDQVLVRGTQTSNSHTRPRLQQHVCHFPHVPRGHSLLYVIGAFGKLEMQVALITSRKILINAGKRLFPNWRAIQSRKRYKSWYRNIKYDIAHNGDRLIEQFKSRNNQLNFCLKTVNWFSQFGTNFWLIRRVTIMLDNCASSRISYLIFFYHTTNRYTILYMYICI